MVSRVPSVPARRPVFWPVGTRSPSSGGSPVSRPVPDAAAAARAERPEADGAAFDRLAAAVLGSARAPDTPGAQSIPRRGQ